MEQKFIEELINIENATKNELNMINCCDSHNQLTEIKISKQKIFAFLTQFIESEITDFELKQKLLNNLNDKIFNFKVTFGKDTGGINKPIIDKKGNPIVYREAWLGTRQFGGKIKTNLKAIRGIIHELAHSVSQKFDLDRLKKYGNPHEKDQSIGEIESKFIEQVFNNYISENAELLGLENSLGMSADEIKNDVEYLVKYDLEDLSEKAKAARDIKKSPIERDYEKRYVVGEVVARIIADKYKKNKSQIMSLYSLYLKQNADLSIDESVRMLTEGECQNFPEIIEKFIKERNSRIESIDKSEIEQYMQEKSAINTSANTTRHITQNKNENTQERTF